MSVHRLGAALLVCGLVLQAGGAFIAASGTLGHLQRLLALPELERGALAASEPDDPWARAGQVRLRAELAGRSLAPAASAAAWRFFAGSPPPPPGARVYLAIPLSVLYYDAQFFWLPAEIAVAPAPSRIVDDASLKRAAAAFRPRSDADLAAAGFDYVLTARGARLELRRVGGEPR